MGILLYRLGIEIYWSIIWLASLFNKKAKKLHQGQKASLKFIQNNPRKSGNLYWFHCSSVGEFEQARPLIEALKASNPALLIAVTFFSPSGFELRKNYPLADYVMYLPKDTLKNARVFVEWLQPNKVFFIKYEFWNFFINQIKTQGAKLYCLNAIFRPSQVFFKSYGGFYRNMLYQFDYFFVQNTISIELLRKIGIQNSILINDTRFDRVVEIAKKHQLIQIAEDFSNQSFVVVLGSVWPSDMEIWYPIQKKRPIKFIVAPHEIKESFLSEIEKKSSLKTIRFSRASGQNMSDYDVLLIDNIGMLSSLYFYAKIAYVGGAFGSGLHNILEAAVYGTPVLFGNRNYKKFNEAVELLDLGCAFAVGDSRQLDALIEKLYLNPSLRENIAHNSKQYVEERSGGTEAILRFLQTKN